MPNSRRTSDPLMSTAATQEPPASPAPAPTPDDCVIVIFGATGDLARRKLLPGLFHLQQAGLMPNGFRIVGCARTELSDDEFRARARSAVEQFGRMAPDEERWEPFARLLSYVGTADGLDRLATAVTDAQRQIGGRPRVLHYLSVPPSASAAVVTELRTTGLNEEARVIMEKPFGTDLASSRALNATLLTAFGESQIFRIDHFLGKEAVQNILALRFANGLFEPVWNRNHIDHVQIDVPETLSIGTRAGFYEGTGAFRDMVVTHLFQVLGFVAMEPPTSLEPETLAAEKTKVFDAMPPLRQSDIVRGQYEGYRSEQGVASDSETETFVAVRAHVDNWRWTGVPFFLRTGKRLAESRQVLTLAFNQPPRRMFPIDAHFTAESFGSDHLTFELGDPGSISVNFLAKVPGPTMELGEAHMDFSYASAFGGDEHALEAYERLIHDVMIGDRTLFTTSEGIERLWEVSAPVLESPPPVMPYKPGSWGPEAIDELIAPRRWHLPAH
jgi:glucose-6-phosphate 1-dehydrogenase